MKSLQEKIKEYHELHLKDKVSLQDFTWWLESIAFDLEDKVSEDCAKIVQEQIKKMSW